LRVTEDEEGFQLTIRRFMAVSLALAAQCLAVPGAFASDEDDRVRMLEDRLRALEDRLAQSDAVIASQREALGVNGGRDVSQGSTLDGFFQTLQVNGSVTTSYAYNFNDPEVNAGAQTLNQFNLNHNELSLDAVKLELGKPTAEAGSAGFQLDVLFGRNAGIFNAAAGGFDPVTVGEAASDTELFLQEAYLAYKLTDALELKAGKFETPLGFEVIDSNDNPNVTHGLLFTFAIPLFHTGVTLGGPLNENLSWLVGVTNGFNNTRENGDNKGLLGRLAYADGPISTSLNIYYGTLGENRVSTSSGALVGDDKATTLINDFIFQYTPSDSFTTWLNVDYGTTNRRPESTGAIFADQGTDPTFFGAAVGFKQKLSEKLYISARGEYFNDDNSSRFGPLFSTTASTPGQLDFDEIDIYTATITLGYQISPSLLGRLELRRDKVDCDSPSCAPFPDRTSGGTEKSDFGIVELVYSFD
jgi:hypothetical protein